MNHTNNKNGHPSAMHQAVHAILDFIDSRGLRPGDSLPTEKELSEITGVSRSILRESLSYLKGLSLITSRRGSGFRLSRADPVGVFEILLRQAGAFGADSLEELAWLRRTLELGLIAEAVAAATEEQIQTAARLAEEMEALIERPDASVDQYNHLEAEFHIAITAPASCRLLDVLNGALRTLFAPAGGSGAISAEMHAGLVRSNREHRILVEAFRLREGAVAREILAKHLCRG